MRPMIRCNRSSSEDDNIARRLFVAHTTCIQAETRERTVIPEARRDPTLSCVRAKISVQCRKPARSGGLLLPVPWASEPAASSTRPPALSLPPSAHRPRLQFEVIVALAGGLHLKRASSIFPFTVGLA